ncbi:hypothetical protein [Providencia phage vB_PreS-Stilesk]|uniref:Uncharacterized protein n=1 Tax=Providencia phage vB_PreS-Stilesk TaxID=2761110 RepID=A0A7G5B146_9CAUD|nr:hypothetical protein JT352_gp40 [Providencia phage vB_PreS-Stilesk]QMV30019.1 hypothetical protein [Providencia phage vB_PreS-Stilesk]
MAKKRKWAFVAEGAEILAQGGHYTNHRTGFVFRTYIVAGGDGVRFLREPYATHGWYVEKNNTTYTGRKARYNVTNEDDLKALDEFVGEERFPGWSSFRD